MPRPAPRPALLVSAAAVLLSAVVAAGGRAAPPPAGAPAGDEGAPLARAAATKTVTLRNIAFNPSRVTVRKGGRVTWVWRDGGTRHNVTSRSFRSGTRASGSFSVTFRRAGTFSYHCTVHPGMNGTVVVTR